MKTILLIEDNKNILENLTEYFEMEGYKILSSSNGKRGIELAEECLPDLIICDVKMAGMDGYAVLRYLVASEKISKIPFIFSTSMAEKVDRAESLALGADEYITKPFELETLLTLAENCIAAGTKRRSLPERPDFLPLSKSVNDITILKAI